jgi:hypothetical protein
MRREAENFTFSGLDFKPAPDPDHGAQPVGVYLLEQSEGERDEGVFRFESIRKDRAKIIPSQEDASPKRAWSVRESYSDLYLVFCCCCRLPRDYLMCCRLRMTKANWIYLFHFVCFCIHLGFAIASYNEGQGHDMRVQLTRVKATWESITSYKYEVVPSDNQFVHIDVITYLFFAFSACAHGVWVVFGVFSKTLWRHLDICFCWWRWAEYSFSASLMVVGIAIVVGIRDEIVLLSLFALMFATMCAGFVTELLSRPEKTGEKDVDGQEIYSLDRWEGDPHPRQKLKTGAPVQSGSAVDVSADVEAFAYTKNYMRRMFPHFLGFAPYSAAWAIVILHFNRSVDDLCVRLQKLMPEFVRWIVFGSVAIFSCFTLVQIVFQYRAPRHYWATELWYCFLSATSKVYLGSILLTNVLNRARYDDAIAVGDNETLARFNFNITAFCNNETEWN